MTAALSSPVDDPFQLKLADEAEVAANGGMTPSAWTFVAAAELAAPLPPMRWLAQGLWPEGSHGVVAGPKKSLKTYTLQAIAVGVAAGLTVLGQFHVPNSQPVVVFVGEGGLIPWRRRLQRIAQAYGVALADLPIVAVPHAGPMDGPEFRDAVARAEADYAPGLVIIDSLYNYHAKGIEAQNLYDRGQMLARLTDLIGPGTGLMIADHMNKGAEGKQFDLDQIAQSGMAAWADSWLGVNHVRSPSPADVAAGSFHLDYTVGSRQWGGRTWRADWEVGSFNDDTGEHDGELTWAVAKSDGASPGPSARDVKARDLKNRIVDEIRRAPWTLTRSQLRENVGGNVADTLALIDGLEAEKLVAVEKRPRPEGEREVKRPVYGIPDQPALFKRSEEVGTSAAPLSPGEPS